jgi:photosystem II oxygen-evolving enhancer protein 2
MRAQVLTSPGTDVKIVSSSVREQAGRQYYEFEFTAATDRFARHQLATVVVNDGKFYTLTTGASERRWGKMKDRLTRTAKSFELIN